MTNTRITDAEVFERRYPVILREFGLRTNSGGRGKYCGGEGVVRDIEFRIPVQVSILSERRVFHPYGLEGGEEGACGINLWVRKRRRPQRADNDSLLEGTRQGEEKGNGKDEGEEEQIINLGGKNTAAMQPGERIIIITPGGGGWGRVVNQSGSESQDKGEGGSAKYGSGYGKGGGGPDNNKAASWQKGSWAMRIAMQESA